MLLHHRNACLMVASLKQIPSLRKSSVIATNLGRKSCVASISLLPKFYENLMHRLRFRHTTHTSPCRRPLHSRTMVGKQLVVRLFHAMLQVHFSLVFIQTSSRWYCTHVAPGIGMSLREISKKKFRGFREVCEYPFLILFRDFGSGLKFKRNCSKLWITA